MTTLFQRGGLWLADKRETAAGLAVTYQRGPLSVSVTSVPSWEDQKVIDSDGISTVIRYRVYRFIATDLVLAGSVIVPREGDRIVETIGGEECTFEIVAPKQNAAARKTDQSGISTTVIAQRVKAR